VCKRDFHTGREWDLLRRAEDKLSSDIERNEDELDLLEPELNDLQSRLAELHQQLLNKQKQYQEAISRQRRLRKQMAFLKQKGFKMSENDAELLRILDEKTTSPEQTTSSAVDIQQLASTAENPNFDQMFQEIAQFPSSF
jgi:chromosome segregation ATPase